MHGQGFHDDDFAVKMRGRYQKYRVALQPVCCFDPLSREERNEEVGQRRAKPEWGQRKIRHQNGRVREPAVKIKNKAVERRQTHLGAAPGKPLSLPKAQAPPRSKPRPSDPPLLSSVSLRKILIA